MSNNYNSIMEQKAKDRVPFSGAPRLTHPDGQWLSQVPDDVLAITGVRVGDFIVNPDTGEILGENTTHKVEPLPKQDKHYIVNITKFPQDAKHIEQLQDWLSVAVDGRKVIKFNDCEKIHDAICGKAKRDNQGHSLSVPEYTKLNNLCKELTFMNFLIGDAKVVAKKIKVSGHGNIRRDYSSLVDKGFVKVETSLDGMMIGQVKLSVHPYFAYVHEKGIFTSSRETCLKNWISKEPPPLLTQDFLDSLPKPQPYSDAIVCDDFKLDLQRRGEACSNYTNDDLIGYYE